MRKIALMLMFIGFFPACRPENGSRGSPVNLSHALHLVDSLSINDEQLYFMYIYADAPDYQPVMATDEGIGCVDDVGRFLEVLETEICRYGKTELLPVALGMTRFLLYMSRADGLWYNFIFADGSINESYITSQADFGWWAIRGLRGLTAAYLILRKFPVDADLSRAVSERLHSMDPHLAEILGVYPGRVNTPLGLRPGWLVKNAPDMNSELLLVLAKLHGQGDFSYREEIVNIADGLMEYQYSDSLSSLDGMYFCWQGTWHNWGNNHSTALLKTYQITRDEKYLQSVRRWADKFVPYLIGNNFPWEITIEPGPVLQQTPYPQIAYGIHSVYSGLHLLADITANPAYRRNAERVFGWFKGANSAGRSMYDPQTGRCFDGIDSGGKVNLNSGAESTVECLLAIQKRGSF